MSRIKADHSSLETESENWSVNQTNKSHSTRCSKFYLICNRHNKVIDTNKVKIIVIYNKNVKPNTNIARS